MLLALLRWFGRNLTTLLLAFVLAIVVWVSAVLTADPNETRIYNRTVTLVGQDFEPHVNRQSSRSGPDHHPGAAFDSL